MTAVVPILPVPDVATALDYYQRVLGFVEAWRWGHPLTLASLCRDKIEIQLSALAERPRAPAHLYIHLTNVDMYHAFVRDAGANITVPIADRDYGMRDFRVVDPVGNEVSFGEVLPR